MTMNAKNLTLQMLSIWLIGAGAWALIHATYVSPEHLVGAFALSLGSIILLTLRR